MSCNRSAGHFLAEVQRRYRALTCYADSGEVKQGGDGRARVLAFATRRDPQGDFSFTLERPHPHGPMRHQRGRLMAGRQHGQAFLENAWAGREVVREPEETLGAAVASVTGVSLGAAHFISFLLFDEVGGRSPLALRRPRFRAQRVVDGTLCWRIVGYIGRDRITLYVGVHDLLIRKRTEKRTALEERRRDIDVLGASSPER